MARPLAEPTHTTEDQITELAKIGCTWDEISAVIGMKERTLRRRYGHLYRKGHELGKKDLRSKMHETAMSGNVTMMIWLSKQRLGMSEKVEEKSEVVSDQTIVYQAQWGGTNEYSIALKTQDP